MTTLDILRAALGWAALINYTMLTVIFFAWMLGREAIMRLHGRWFRLRAEQFDAILYAAMAGCKLAIFLLFVAPWLALHLLT